MKPYEHLNGKEVVWKYSGNKTDSGKIAVVNIDYDLGISLVNKDDPEDCFCSMDGPFSPFAKDLLKRDYTRIYENYKMEFDAYVEAIESGVFDADKLIEEKSIDDYGNNPECQFSL